MQINVAQLLKEPVGARRIYQIDEPVAEGLAVRIKGEVILTHTSRGILAMGEFSTNVSGACARCLKDATADVKFHMEDEYFPLNDIVTGSHQEVEPGEFTIGDDHILDMSEAIRQYVIMSTPTKMLCRPECPGICPVCGHDLSAGSCGHEHKKMDSRWEKLIQLEKESKV
jgi:uncharacterized protein